MKNALRKSFLSTACMLLVGIISLTGVTYAWFTQGTNANIDNMQMTVTSSAGGLEISTNGTDWVSKIDLSDSKKSNLQPVSTVGGKKGTWDFFTAVADATTANKFTATTSDAANYIQQTLYIKNTNDTPLTINLGTGDNATTITSQGSKMGHLAARLGIQFESVQSLISTHPTTKASICNKEEGFGIFEPNSLTHLTGINSTSKEIYYGVKAAASFKTTDTASTNADALDAVTTVDDTSNFTIVIPAQSYIQISVYLWLEGQDVDCTNAVGSSVVDLDLYFEIVND